MIETTEPCYLCSQFHKTWEEGLNCSIKGALGIVRKINIAQEKTGKSKLRF